jgi:2-(1,2-epoxy-1,2-dihydrophenyl)acetyl-CoA isomerase
MVFVQRPMFAVKKNQKELQMDVNEDKVVVEINADGVAWVTLNEPTVRNALSPALRQQFCERIPPLEFNADVRCVVIQGAGEHFMAGGDIRVMKERLEWPSHERSQRIVAGLHDVNHAIFALRRMPKPVIASIRGAAAGFGLSLVGAADLAIAADDAVFTLAYCHIGASPDGGASYFLGRTLGMKQQMELAFLGDRFGPDRAKELGIINWVVPKADLQSETDKLATRLAKGPTRAYANAKALFNATNHLSMESHLQMEAERIADSMSSDDHAEGVRAFLEKRQATFRGN